MKEYVWFVCLLFDLCFAENEAGCCGNVDGLCSKCCQNYYNFEGLCKVCPIGFFGDKCKTECAYPWYGELCGFKCDCPDRDCHPALGCQNKDFRTTSTRDLQEGTSYITQRYRQRTTNSRRNIAETTLSSVEKQFKSTAARHVTPIYTVQPTLVVHRNDNSTDALWLVSVVKILGYTLAVSLLVIMGLVCLFICKRRREGAIGKLLNISQAEHELRLHQNVDGVADIARNGMNGSSLYQGLSEISHLRRPDDKGRKESVGKSINTYMEPISREEVDTRTSVDNPSYVDVTLTDSTRS